MEKVLMPMVGKIVSVDVKEGEQVEVNQTLGIFESMKMEMPLVAPVAGAVANLKAEAGQVLQSEQLFCDIV